MATTKKAPKTVQVIARYAHKTNGKLNGIVTYAVRSSNGKDIYCTTLIEGKASGCGCPAHKPCYHMTQLEAREADRKPAYEVVAIEEVKVEAPALVEHNDYVMNITAKAEHKQNMLAEIREIQERAIAQQVAKTPDMMNAALTSNRAFSILR